MSIDQQAGNRLGAYLIGDVLGRGGMGVVYRATHVHLGREVALKLLAPELSGQTDFRERFLRESRLAASLEHPNVVAVYDAGDWEGTLFIAMRYMDGTDLARFIAEQGALPPATALTMLEHVGSALDAAHRGGLVHRDVKPANVLASRGVFYLTDFGLTKQSSATDATRALTQIGQFLGTLDYAAPEQIEGGECDGRTDIYALTAMLHECLTDSRPFPKGSELALIGAHLYEPPPRPSKLVPELGEAIDHVLAQGMAKSAADRFATCADLVAAARRALGVPGAGVAGVGVAGVGVAGVGVAGVGVAGVAGAGAARTRTVAAPAGGPAPNRATATTVAGTTDA